MLRSQAARVLYEVFSVYSRAKHDKSHSVIVKTPFYIFEPPGLGMEDEVNDIAGKLGLAVYKVSLLQYVRNSFFQILEIIQDAKDGGILLLTDLGDLPTLLIMEILAFLKTRRIGDYSIPDDMFIVICGNRDFCARAKKLKMCDRSGWYDIDEEQQFGFEDRMEKGLDGEFIEAVRYLSVYEDLDEQIAFAKENHLHPVIIEYLKYNKEDSIYKDENDMTKQQFSTKKLEMISEMLYAYEAAGMEITEDTFIQFGQYSYYSIYHLYMLVKYHFTREDADRICMGEATEDLKELFENAPRSFLIDIASRRIHKRFFKYVDEMPDSMVSERISNVIHFYQNLSMGEELLEELLNCVTSFDYTVDVLSKVKNEDVLKLCRKRYGLKKRLESALAAFEYPVNLQKGQSDDDTEK